MVKHKNLIKKKKSRENFKKPYNVYCVLDF